MKADFDLGNHGTGSPDPGTLIKANPSRAVSAAGAPGYKAGNCPLRKSPEAQAVGTSQFLKSESVQRHTLVMKGAFSCVPP